MRDRIRRSAKALVFGLIVGLAGALFGLTDVGATFERTVGLSWLFKIRGTVAPPSDVVVVAINGQTGDQLSLPSLPRDWPRSIHARLVDELVRRGASSIVFDMQFDKPKTPKDDHLFSAAVDSSDRVTLIELITGKRQPITDANGIQTSTVWVEELIKPIQELSASAKGLATFPLPKIDAAVYEFWAFKESVGDAPTLPAVAFQIHALQAYPAWLSLLEQLNVPALDALPRTVKDIGKADQLSDLMRIYRSAFENDAGAGDRLARLLEQKSAQVSAHEHTLLKALLGMYAGAPHRVLNFYGPPGTIKTIPYQTVIHGIDSKPGNTALDLKGKTVFVGFSDLFDPGHPDRFYTVFTGDDGVDLSGVEIAATAFGNLLTDSSIKPTDGMQTLAVLFAFGLVIGTLAYFLPALLGVPLTLVLAAAYASTAQWLFNSADQWLPLATPLLAQFPLALFLGLLGQYLLERRRGKRISKALGYYLPENIARDLTNNRSDPNAFNKVVYGTCLATDMSGFSTISEQLPPDELAVFLNDYFDTLAQALKRHQVSVTEFRADAIMCAWTSESPSIVVRQKAVLAALDAAEAIAAFKQRHAMLKASLRIGLESGHFYIGHAGGGGHFVFSIVGDTANTASRIESLNKHLGTSILATRSALEELDGLLLRPLSDFVFVGKTEALPIVEIMATTAHTSERQRRLCEGFAAALGIFHAAEWSNAADAFETLLREFPDDGPARFYLARCRSYLSAMQPPEDPRVIWMDAK